MGIAKHRSELMQRQMEAHQQREALESQHEAVWEELRSALDQQAALGPAAMKKSHPAMIKVQSLVTREREVRSSLLVLKEDIARQHAFTQHELNTLENAHHELREQLSRQLSKRIAELPEDTVLATDPAITSLPPKVAEPSAPPSDTADKLPVAATASKEKEKRQLSVSRNLAGTEGQVASSI